MLQTVNNEQQVSYEKFHSSWHYSNSSSILNVVFLNQNATLPSYNLHCTRLLQHQQADKLPTASNFVNTNDDVWQWTILTQLQTHRYLEFQEVVDIQLHSCQWAQQYQRHENTWLPLSSLVLSCVLFAAPVTNLLPPQLTWDISAAEISCNSCPSAASLPSTNWTSTIRPTWMD